MQLTFLLLHLVTAMGIPSFFFHVVAYVFNLFIPFWLFDSSTDGKSKQVREPEEFSDSFSPFQAFETRTSLFFFYEGTVVMCQETLTVMTVARGRVSFADSYRWTILMVNLLR